ncbi:MAG: hypothetical protein HFI72_04600 [Peptococcaceae bacterium]|jgi:hypothetical protein|nr:hypothetical protein [Peptococcaceae bacterium]
MVPPIPQAAWAAPSSTNSAPVLSLALGSNVKYQLENGKTYTLSNASVTNTVIEVPSGRTATVVVPKNVAVTINDYEDGCSPISLLGSGHLILVVDGTLTVTGGAGTQAAIPTVRIDSTTSTVGNGAYAGISVPSTATLTVRGTGTVSARGGDASSGNNGAGGISGGPGGGGAGAGIGGNGGGGGLGAWDKSASGANGSAGGTVQIYDQVKVFAYGGAGGATSEQQLSTGGGGYPAAGIGGGGGGGGGGDHATGGAGFSSAGYKGQTGGTNGTGPTSATIDGGGASWTRYAGGAYFNGPLNPKQDNVALTGGLGAVSWSGSSTATSGNGGVGGAGGKVYKADKATLTVANGSYVTSNQQKWGQSPTPIYAQSGYDLNLIRKAKVTKVSARTPGKLVEELGATGKSSSIQATALAGVGSGAGYLESSNGSFTIQKVPDGATLYMRNADYF